MTATAVFVLWSLWTNMFGDLAGRPIDTFPSLEACKAYAAALAPPHQELSGYFICLPAGTRP